MENKLSRIDDVAVNGDCVVSASRDSVIELVKQAVEGGISASFYVPRTIAEAVLAWYWTAERIREFGVEVVSNEEQRSIEKEFGLEDVIHFANRIECENCGHVYGAFEFVEQGIRTHGKEAVEAVLDLKSAVLIRVDPTEVSICPNCEQRITQGGLKLGERIVGGTEVPHYYGGTSAYAGCCRGGQLQR
ncbi:hypothetical protein MRQ86_34510 [Streptomyces sp. MMS21 TC-5]|uniref:hypothetical protein n=1 Tax=Streptomyces sp. MMS21 TC-5 TaxID=2925833 RepID=UPI001F60435F|nr:hypothetical protein [Streptomyces sp. MMS21 TC-5]MCI4085328.1 hypothetical protein [Streptomyces sp. MMS21 TC-5]